MAFASSLRQSHPHAGLFWACLCSIAAVGVLLCVMPLRVLGEPSRSCVPVPSGLTLERCPALSIQLLLRSLLHVESYDRPMKCHAECTALFDLANDVAETERPLRARQLLPPQDTVAYRVPTLHALDTIPYFTLRTEMEAWLRARRTVGMNPEEYEYVVGMLRTFTNETEPGSVAADVKLGRLFPLINASKDWVQDNCAPNGAIWSEQCHGAKAARAYRLRVNQAQSTMPWLFVDRATLQAAKALYANSVLGGIIVRVYHLSAATQRSQEESIPNLLRFVQRMWRDAERRVWELADMSLPLLASIDLDELIGPALPFEPPTAAIATGEMQSARKRKTTRTSHQGDNGAAASHTFVLEADGSTSKPRLPRRKPFQHSPYTRILPTAVVYHYSEDDDNCPLCSVYSAAFDLLPSVVHRMCVSGHSAIVSCSPLLLFVSVKETQSFRVVPRVTLYAHRPLGSLDDSAYALHKLSRLLRGEWEEGVVNPEYDISPSSLSATPFSTRDANNYPNAEGIADILQRPDHFEATTISMSGGRNPELRDVLLDIVRALIDHGSIQPRLLSPDEVTEIMIANLQRRMLRSRRGVANNHSNSTELNHTGSNESGEETERTSAEAADGELRTVVSVRTSARHLIDWHIAEMYGRSPKGRYDYITAQWEIHKAQRRALHTHSALGFAWRSLSVVDKIVLLLAFCALVTQFALK